MLRVPFVLLRNLLVFLKFLWSTFWFKVGYFFRRKKKLYIAAKLEDNYRFGPRTGWARRLQETPSYLELRDLFDRVGETDDIDGVVFATNGMSMGAARAQGLAAMFDEVRESGKRVVSHMRMPTTNEYLLATAADDVLLTPSGRLYTFGPRFDQIFAADTLERLGVEPQIIHIGDFKTASHRMIHREMTAPQKAMMESLHESLTSTIRQRIADRRGLSDERAADLFREAPSDSQAARRRGFVDHEVFRGRLDSWLRWQEETLPTQLPPFRDVTAEEPAAPPEVAEPPEDEEPPEPEDAMMVAAEDVQSVIPPKFDWKPLFGRPERFAVMDLTGMIVMPDMSIPGTNAPVIDPDEVMPKLREISESGMFSGLLLHINSPGGSALASDIIWEAIQRVRTRMPVVAYCTDVVGSGGYYLAVSADHIVCHDVSITGSIGVVTGSFSASDLVDKTGVNVESIYDDEADTFTSIIHPLGDEMMDRLSEDARSFYRRFLQRVGQNRELPKRRLHRYARGRVYLGDDAERRGLVDELGSIDDALEALGTLSDVDPETVDIEFVAHRQPNLRQMLGLSVSAESFMPDALTEPLLAAKMLEREHMLALMPQVPKWT